MNYREEVLKNVASINPSEQLMIGALGLAGESGEVIDLIKKFVFHGKDYDRELMIKELGDVRWYLELLCHLNSVSMQEVEEKNIAKLKARHPNGWSKETANMKLDEVKSENQQK